VCCDLTTGPDFTSLGLGLGESGDCSDLKDGKGFWRGPVSANQTGTVSIPFRSFVARLILTECGA
jgi:hypothetical protein